MYAHYLFNAFDTAQNGSVKFEVTVLHPDLMPFISVLCVLASLSILHCKLWGLLGCGLEGYSQLKRQNLILFNAGFSCRWVGFLSTGETSRLCQSVA